MHYYLRTAGVERLADNLTSPSTIHALLPYMPDSLPAVCTCHLVPCWVTFPYGMQLAHFYLQLVPVTPLPATAPHAPTPPHPTPLPLPAYPAPTCPTPTHHFTALHILPAPTTYSGSPFRITRFYWRFTTQVQPPHHLTAVPFGFRPAFPTTPQLFVPCKFYLWRTRLPPPTPPHPPTPTPHSGWVDMLGPVPLCISRLVPSLTLVERQVGTGILPGGLP